MKIRPMMKYLALIMKGMGKSMIFGFGVKDAEGQQQSEDGARRAYCRVSTGLAPSSPVKEMATVVRAAPTAQKK